VSDVREECLRRLERAGLPEEVRSVARRCERCFELGVYEHDATAPWVSRGGRAVLIGDAAHAMAPFLGQGANQAIQDGYCLATRLAAARGRSDRGSSASSASSASSGSSGSSGIVDWLARFVSPLQSYALLRRAPVVALQIESRLLGAMETAGGGAGTLPQLVRDAFFLINGKLGVAAQVFVKGARPWV
jgi:hypothetical protein